MLDPGIHDSKVLISDLFKVTRKGCLMKEASSWSVLSTNTGKLDLANLRSLLNDR